MTRWNLRAASPAAWLLIVSTLAAGAGTAAAQDDVAGFASGDQVTGKIKLLDRGQLNFSTNDFGLVNIKWERVVRLVSTRMFDVETVDGRHHRGTLRAAPIKQVDVAGAAATVRLDLDRIVAIRPLDQGWLRGLDGWLNGGFSYSRGSGVTQWTSDFSAARRRASYNSVLTTSSVLTSDTDGNYSSRATLAYNYTQFLGKNWLLAGIAQGERNSELGLDLRTSLGAGVGYRPVISPRNQLITFGGISVNRELRIDESNQTNVEALLGLTYSWFVYHFPKTFLDIDTRLYPNLTDTGRYRVEFNGSARREIFHDFNVAVSVYDSYDRRPPASSSLKNDVGVTVTIGWLF